MVTSREVASDQIHSDRLQQIESSNTGSHESISNKKESPLSVLPAKELCKANLEGSSLSITDDKELDTLHQRQNPDAGIHSSQSNQDGSSLSTKLEKEMNNLQQGQSPDTVIRAVESNQEGGTRSIMPSKLSDNLQERHDQEKFTLSTRPEKVLDKLPLRRNPDIGVHTLQSDQEGKSPSVIPDKPSEDGYNWRKYGQKLVRGNKFIRSYYKCTFPNCSAKKQVERSHDGHITEIKYLRKHEHPKPQRSPQIAAPFVMPIQARRADEPPLTISREDQSSDVHGDASHHVEPTEIPQRPIVAASDDVSEVAVSHSNKMRDEVDSDGDPDLKRQKIETSSVDEALMNKMNGEPRLVVETRSEVDIVNDGYRWRKYGQKLVKGNPNPRSYYRCSTAGCPVKKHVERASHDQKVVITTYEGQHDHDVPSGRFVTHNTGAAVETTTTTVATTTTTSLSGESRSEQEEKEVVCRDLVVGVSAN